MNGTRVEFSGQTFEASAKGFTWKRADGETVTGPWSRVASVMTFEARASVYGAQVAHWQYLGVTLDDGTGFSTRSTAAAMFGVAAVTVKLAGPVILERLRRELYEGKALTFGPVSLSHDTLGFKGRSWPLEQVAGHKAEQGYWMFDTGSADAPKLSGKVMLNRVPNFFALRALLNELKPGLEYEDGVDKGTVFRPSASSHDPRYVSGRTRLIFLGGPLAAAFIAWLGYSALQQARYLVEAAHMRANEERNAKLVAVAEAATVDPDAPWTCDVKLAELSGVGFTARTKLTGFRRPGFRDHEEMVFGLSDSIEVSTGTERWLLLTRINSLSPDAEERKLGLTYLLIDTSTGALKCTGNQTLAFSGRVALPYEREERVERAIETAMRQALCDSASTACLGPLAVPLRLAGELPGAVAAAPMAPVKTAPAPKPKAAKGKKQRAR